MLSVPPTRVVPPLEPHDTVAVVAPASAPLSRVDLDRGLARLASTGLNVIAAYDMAEPPGYLADTDEVRARHLNAIFARQDVRAIFCVRGGYGSLRILEHLDYRALEESPKIVVGYSDITAIQLAVLARAGIPGLSAAMVATDWGDISESESSTVLKCLAGSADAGLFSSEGLTLKAEKSGSAEGRALGGNLTILCRLIGTPYFPDPQGAILFVEEVGEQPYRVDGLLAQMKLAGVLERIAGLVIGGITDATPPHDRPSLSLEDVLDHYVQFVNGPVASGLAYGHFQPKVPMPIGTLVRLQVDGSSCRLKAEQQLVTTP